MTGVPAAVARPAREHTLDPLHGRLHRLLERPAHPHGARLAGRLLPAPSDDARPPEGGEFPWLLVADWLAGSFGLSSTVAGRRVLGDLRWIQYCVYGLFRAQDDLVDGDVEDPLLAVEANQLLVEAASCAARHFEGTSPFWPIFRSSIDATSGAIVELDRLQRSAERADGDELGLYVDLSACLKLAAAGVAIASGRERDWRRHVSPALDRLSVAGQILDDLEDVRDDLARGRINHAAWFLARPVFGSTPEATEAVVASNLATTCRLDALLRCATELMEEAARLLPPYICRRTHRYLVDYGHGIRALGEEIAAGRRELFGVA